MIQIADIFDLADRLDEVYADTGVELDDDARHDLLHHVATALGIPTDGTTKR